MAATTVGKVKWEAIFVCFCFFIGKPVTLHDLINIQTQLRGKLGSCYNEVFIFVQLHQLEINDGTNDSIHCNPCL